MFSIMLFSCAAERKEKDAQSPFNTEDVVAKWRQKTGFDKYYKGDDIQSYYKDWYKKVVEHPLFDNFIQSRQNILDAMYLSNTHKTSHYDRSSIKCQDVKTEPKDPKSFDNLNDGHQYNFCVMKNIEKVFEKEIPEYSKLKNNKEASSDFNYYFTSLYSFAPPVNFNNY